MSGKLKHLTPQEARLQRVAVLRELADLLAEVEREGGQEPSAETESLSNANTQSYARLPLADAILLYLSTCKDAPTTKEIWKALERAGRESDSQSPVRSVRQALKKLAVANDDVFHIGWARWHLKSKYTAPKLKKLMAAPQNGTGGRTPEEHSGRTRAGLEKAKARGKRLGAKAKIDDAMKLRIQQMAAIKTPRKVPLQHIANSEGIALSSIFGVFPGGRKAILAWKPPAAMSQEESVAGPLFDSSKQPHVRLVK